MKIGSKVIFLGFHLNDWTSGEVLRQGGKIPIKGEIYTIRSFAQPSDCTGKYIILEEIVNINVFDADGNEISFNTLLFREVDFDYAENVLKKIADEYKNEIILN